MSRSRPNERPNNSKFSNAAMLAYQRNQLHKSQERAGIMKKAPALKPLALTFDSSNWLFWLFFLGLVQSSFAARTQKSGSEKFADQVRGHINSASSLTDVQVQLNVCENVQRSVVELAAVNDAFAERAQATLSQPDFKIICGNTRTLQDVGALGSSMFDSWRNWLIVNVDNINLSDLSHEWIHAFFHYVHEKDSNCDLASDKTKTQSAVPFYPMTRENMAEFNRWMDRGDKRITHLFQLHMKAKTGKAPLTNDETFQLQRAKKLLAKTTLASGTDTFAKSDDLLKALKNAGWPQKSTFNMMIRSHDLTITNVLVNHDSITLSHQIDDAIESIYFGVTHFKDLCQANSFKDDNIKAAERIAHVFQYLDKEGQRFLYPEATDFIEKQNQKCRPERFGLSKSEL